MEKGKICLLLICVAIVAFLEGNALTGRNCAVRTGALENRTADQDEAVVALTFDDGPHPVYTPEMLDGLEGERCLCAPFFFRGSALRGMKRL